MASVSDHAEGVVTMENTHEQNGGFRFVHGYAASIEKFPVLICLVILFTTFGLGGITYLFHGFPSFPDPQVGFEPRGTILSSRGTSLHNLMWADREILSPVPYNVSLSQDILMTNTTSTTEGILLSGRTNRHHVTNGSIKEDSEVKEMSRHCYPDPSFPKIVYLSSNGESLFQMKHLKAICDSENELIRSHPIFPSECIKSKDSTECCNSWSLGYAVALMNNKTSCNSIDEDDVEITKNVLAMCSKYYLSGELNGDEISQHIDIPTECTKDSIVYTIFHYLLPQSFVYGLRNNEEKADPAFTLSFSPMHVSCSVDKCKINITIIYKDNFQNLVNINDSIIDIAGLDFALKYYLFNELLISDLLYVAIGVLTAIVIIWLYTGSLTITIGSVLNMVMSLILAYFLYHVVFRITFFPFLNVASIVLVIGIGADDTFIYVDLWKASKDKIGQSVDKRVSVLEEATRHAFVTLLVTSLTTSSALYVTAITNTAAGKCFAVFAGSALLANLFYTITWLPGIIIIHDKYFCNCPGEVCPQLFCKAYNTILKIPNKFFQNFLPKLVFLFRFIWIVLFSLIGAAGLCLIFVFPGLTLEESGEFRLYKDMQPFENYDQNYKHDLAFVNDSRSNFPLTFVWGVQPTHDVDPWDPFDFGHLELDNGFNFGDNESQIWLSQFCKDITKQTFYNGNSTDNDNFCFIDSFTIWMNRNCLPFEDKSCCQHEGFPFPKELFDRCVVEFMTFACQSVPCYSHTPGVRFDKNNTLRALYLNLEGSEPYTLQFRPIDKFWKNLSSWVETKLSKAPPNLQGGWAYSQKEAQLTFYDLQSGLAGGTALTVGISLVTATIVLLVVTQNILITIYAMITITFIVSSVVGILVLLGWQLNIFEAITFSLAIGLSVDFTIHYGVAFRIAPYEDRKKRTFYAIETLSAPITVAAISTFSAGAVMIPAIVINYSQIGVFLTLVMSLSWLFSTFFFSSLCMTLGPNGSLGQISLRKLRKVPKDTTDSQRPTQGFSNAGFIIDSN